VGGGELWVFNDNGSSVKWNEGASQIFSGFSSCGGLLYYAVMHTYTHFFW
jgi:hypothetical protein